MEQLLSLFVRSIFVDNMIFAFFLGMCSYLAVSKNVKTAVGLGIAVTFVLVVTLPVNYLLQTKVLEANAIKDSIMQYTDQKLAEVEDIIAHAVEVSQTHYSNLVSDLNRINDVVQTNRAEFHAQNEELGTEEMDAAGNVGDDLNVM